MNNPNANLLATLQAIIDESEKATPDWWICGGDISGFIKKNSSVALYSDGVCPLDNEQKALNRQFTVHARTNVPRLARALLRAVEALEQYEYIEKNRRDNVDKSMGCAATEILSQIQAIVEGGE